MMRTWIGAGVAVVSLCAAPAWAQSAPAKPAAPAQSAATDQSAAPAQSTATDQSAATGGQPDRGPADPFVPDAAIQTAITDALRADDPAGQAARFDRLAELAAARPADLVANLVWRSAHADGVREGMAAGVLLERLGLAREVVLDALLPHVQSGDERFARSIRSILHGLEGVTPSRPPDFSIYRERIEAALRAGQEPPAPLVTYLYESDPGQALLLMMRAHGVREPERIREILWAEHVVADVLFKHRYGFLPRDRSEPRADEQLDAMAAHEAWWARLYTAEIMQQHAAFRDAERLAALRADAHPVVRAAAGREQAKR